MHIAVAEHTLVRESPYCMESIALRMIVSVFMNILSVLSERYLLEKISPWYLVYLTPKNFNGNVDPSCARSAYSVWDLFNFVNKWNIEEMWSFHYYTWKWCEAWNNQDPHLTTLKVEKRRMLCVFTYTQSKLRTFTYSVQTINIIIQTNQVNNSKQIPLCCCKESMKHTTPGAFKFFPSARRKLGIGRLL